MKKHLLIVAGISIGIGNSLVILWIFLTAYFHGYKTLVVINDYGEANFELILIPVMLIISLISLVVFMKVYGKPKKE